MINYRVKIKYGNGREMKKLIMFLLVVVLLVGCQTENVNELKDEETITKIEEKNKEEKTNEENSEEIHFDLANVKFTDAEGKSYTIEDFKGKITALNFFNTKCSYCIRELPDLESIMETEEDVVFVPISVGEKPEDVEKFLQEKDINLKPYFDRNFELTSMFKITGFPTAVYFDEEGNLLGMAVGYEEKETVLDLISAIREGRVEPIENIESTD